MKLIHKSFTQTFTNKNLGFVPICVTNLCSNFNYTALRDTSKTVAQFLRPALALLFNTKI